jgi:hypothetical protein
VRRILIFSFGLLFITISLSACFRLTPQIGPLAEQALRFAIIGDYGSGNSAEAAVAALIEGWDVDFVG